MTKLTQKRAVNKDVVKSKQVHKSVPPRLEGKVKNAKMRNKKATQKQIQKPRKKRKG